MKDHRPTLASRISIVTISLCFYFCAEILALGFIKRVKVSDIEMIASGAFVLTVIGFLWIPLEKSHPFLRRKIGLAVVFTLGLAFTALIQVTYLLIRFGGLLWNVWPLLFVLMCIGVQAVGWLFGFVPLALFARHHAKQNSSQRRTP